MIKKSKRNRLYWPWWRWLLTVLCMLALVLSGILSWHFLMDGQMVGCGGGSSCDEVLNSRWSMIAGLLPVSGLAMGVYLTMLLATFFIGPDTELSIRRLAWKVLLVLAGSVAGGALWFTVIQKWIIGGFCFYCMTTHFIGLVITGLVYWRAIREKESGLIDHVQQNFVVGRENSLSTHASSNQRLQVSKFLLTGLAFAGVMAVSQVGLSSSSAYSDGESHENLPAINSQTVPLIGAPDAPYIVKLLFDYECSHCQKIHFMLEEAVRRYHGKLAFALCPTPLNTQCNPYVPRDVDAFKNSCELARIGLSVWLANREAFPAFETWMFTYETGDRWHPRSPGAAGKKAVELVGETEYREAMADSWLKGYMQSCVQLFGQTLQNGKGGIPKLILGSRWVIPEPANTDDLIRILQKSLDLPKP